MSGYHGDLWNLSQQNATNKMLQMLLYQFLSKELPIYTYRRQKQHDPPVGVVCVHLMNLSSVFFIGHFSFGLFSINSWKNIY